MLDLPRWNRMKILTHLNNGRLHLSFVHLDLQRVNILKIEGPDQNESMRTFCKYRESNYKVKLNLYFIFLFLKRKMLWGDLNTNRK